MFTLGGITGIFVAAFPFDWQAHDTYFVVAHMHYVLFGGAIMALLAGLHYWWPKLFGRMLNEKLGKLEFALVFIGFNVTFAPQHLLGLDGMARRIYTYSDQGVMPEYNLVSTIGSYVMGAGLLLFFVNALRTPAPRAARRQRPVAGGHARVVHDLAAAALELRPRPVRDERAPAARPPAAAERVGMSDGLAPGPWLRACAVFAALATGVAAAQRAARADAPGARRDRAPAARRRRGRPPGSRTRACGSPRTRRSRPSSARA